jgi:ankyrin repeat protein
MTAQPPSLKTHGEVFKHGRQSLCRRYTVVLDRRRKKQRMNRIDQELFEAGNENNLPEVRRLLSVGADVNAPYDEDGETPLLRASFLGHLQVVNELLKHGADSESTDFGGLTSLSLAACKGRLAVVKELLLHGADIDAIDDGGSTRLHVASGNGHLAVVNELLSPSDSNGTTTSILGKRKSRGANIGAKNHRGNTPLHLASHWGHLAIAKALVSSGADILAVNNGGHLSIHEAVIFRKSEVA